MIREQDRKLEQIEGLRLNCMIRETKKIACLQAMTAACDTHRYALEKILENYCTKRSKR